MNYFNEKQKSSTMKILIILKIIRNQTVTMFIKCKKHEMIHILSKISQKLILNYAISISWQVIRFKSWRCYLDVNVNLSPTLRKKSIYARYDEASSMLVAGFGDEICIGDHFETLTTVLIVFVINMLYLIYCISYTVSPTVWNQINGDQQRSSTVWNLDMWFG